MTKSHEITKSHEKHFREIIRIKNNRLDRFHEITKHPLEKDADLFSYPLSCFREKLKIYI